MKRFLVLVCTLIVSFTVFGSQQMVMDVLTHWNNNGIMYQQSEDYLSTEISDNIDVWLEKDTDAVIYVFEVQKITVDDLKALLVTPSMPFSYKVNADIVKYLNNALTYFNNFEKFPSLSYEILGEYEYFVGIEYMLIQASFLLMVLN